MTVTSKKKVIKKSTASFKTKSTKKKAFSEKKEKVIKKMKKKQGDGKKKKVESIETEGTKLMGKAIKKKAKERRKKVNDKEKDMEEAGPEMASLTQTVEEGSSHEFDQEEMVTEEGDNGAADDGNEVNSGGEEEDLSEHDAEDDNVGEEEDDDVGEEEGDNVGEEEGDDMVEEEHDDVGEEEEDEGYVEPVSKEVPSETTETSQVKKHVIFDDDETFENLPVLTSDAARKSPTEEVDESDSDAPPEEESISMGKDIFEEDNVKMREEIIKLKKQVKEARRLKHERNKEQQQKKRERLQKLEKTRLPTDLLDAVAKEETETKIAVIAKPMGKRKTFDEDDEPFDSFSEAVDDEGLITLDRGVRVRAVQQELKKSKTIASIAAEFRQKAIYSKKSLRMSSLAQRQMLIKQKKSGKNLLAS